MGSQQKADYEKQLEQVDAFIVMIKKYKAITSYTEHLARTLVLTILSENSVDLTPEKRQELETFFAGLSDLHKEVLV